MDEEWPDIIEDDKNSPPEIGLELIHGTSINSQSYKVFHFKEAEKEYLNLLQKSISLLALNEDDTIKLLMNYQWNSEKIFNDLFIDEKTKEKMFLESGITPKEISGDLTHNCPICSEELNSKNSYSLACKHVFCYDCWSGFLTSSLNDGKKCLKTNCPALKCNVIVGSSAFKKFLSPKEYEKYHGFLVRSFTDDSKEIRWCPRPNCDYFAKNTSLASIPIVCQCGNKFCFRCGLNWHDPLNCDMIKRWNQKNVDEGENANWIIANTKACPKCKKQIEKNQGCNHMTCSMCRHEFCWICLAAWSTHGEKTGGYYKCTVFEQNQNAESKAKARAAEDAKHALQKYLFHFERFMEQNRAMKMAQEKLMPKINQIIEVLHTAMNYPINEVTFLEEGVKTVIDARQVIANSYVYVYYITNEKEKTLFNYQKELLEFETEDLHHNLEKEFDAFCDPEVLDRKPFYNYKSIVTNLISVTKKFYKNFIEGVKEGVLGLNQITEIDEKNPGIKKEPLKDSKKPTKVNKKRK